MPVLDQGEEQAQQQQSNQEQQNQNQLVVKQEGPPVSMPSLDDDADTSQPASSDQVPMDLDEIQNAADNGQIKFILNENGQLIQLDNSHILTTDADGNQILVQGTDSEHLQQLLQSVGVLQTGDGDGEQTFQMIQGENNQMILVQGDNNEAQLIDASMLNEDGHLVIQQHGDGELPEGMHVVNEDGVQVPVSIAFAQHLNVDSDHQENQEQELESHEELSDNQQQNDQHQSSVDSKNDSQTSETSADDGLQETNIKNDDNSQSSEQIQQVSNADSDVTTVTTSTTTPVTSTTGESYFNIDELMNQSDQKVNLS